jgi:hypothetical protein
MPEGKVVVFLDDGVILLGYELMFAWSSINQTILEWNYTASPKYSYVYQHVET